MSSCWHADDESPSSAGRTRYPASQFQRQNAPTTVRRDFAPAQGKVVQHRVNHLRTRLSGQNERARFKQRHAKEVKFSAISFSLSSRRGRKAEFNIFLGDRLTSLQEGRASLPVRVPRKRKTG